MRGLVALFMVSPARVEGLPTTLVGPRASTFRRHAQLASAWQSTGVRSLLKSSQSAARPNEIGLAIGADHDTVGSELLSKDCASGVVAGVGDVPLNVGSRAARARRLISAQTHQDRPVETRKRSLDPLSHASYPMYLAKLKLSPLLKIKKRNDRSIAELRPNAREAGRAAD